MALPVKGAAAVPCPAGARPPPTCLPHWPAWLAPGQGCARQGASGPGRPAFPARFCAAHHALRPQSLPTTEASAQPAPQGRSQLQDSFRQLAKCSGERGRAAGVGESSVPPQAVWGLGRAPPPGQSPGARQTPPGLRSGWAWGGAAGRAQNFGVRFSLDFSPSCCLWEVGAPKRVSSPEGLGENWGLLRTGVWPAVSRACSRPAVMPS